MTKQDLVNEIYAKTRIEKVAIEDVINAFMDSVKTSVADNNDIFLRGFATIGLWKKLVFFKPCKEFKALIKEKQG